MMMLKRTLLTEYVDGNVDDENDVARRLHDDFEENNVDGDVVGEIVNDGSITRWRLKS